MRALPLILLVLGACEAEPAAWSEPLPTDLAATPTAPFVAGQMRAGQPAQLSWYGVPPGSTVTFGVSATGASGGPCPPSLGFCLDIEPALYLLGTVTADSSGTAALSLASVPASVTSGTSLYFQAVAQPPGSAAVPFKSAVYARVAGITFCTRIFDPVCGANGVTYGNACEAEAAGWASQFDGPCP